MCVQSKGRGASIEIAYGLSVDDGMTRLVLLVHPHPPMASTSLFQR